MGIANPLFLLVGQQNGLESKVDAIAGQVVDALASVFFLDIWPGEAAVPMVVAWLVVGAIFFTLKMGFINLRGFRHAIAVTRGRYDNPADEGEVSHFQALASALSATVGLGTSPGLPSPSASAAREPSSG